MTNHGAPDPLIAGLVELCRIQGVTTSAEQLTDGLPKTHWAEKGESLAGLALRRVNMSCRVSREPLATLPEHCLPALLFLKDGRTVVVDP
ncbi:hypothetical protein ACFQFQ_04105 [Sulfitobacter porphyrae]|uniref:Uncharacterized protein n=1 Tax=Sulfitobacter porphyrae TaxID=1246864 RepID=A0ABW2B0U4_9RHOB